MRIGILTYHRSHNCGALLQAYALREFLKLKGRLFFCLFYFVYSKTIQYNFMQ